jgi:Xaa-Pro aminopeptidase
VAVADPVHQELIKVQREVFNRLMENLKPGVTVKELAEISQKTGEKAAPQSGPAAGVTAQLTMHGRGAGDDGPIITGSARSPRQLAVALKENMVFIFKPSARATDGSICTWGDTVVITANGGRRLGKRPHDLAVSST